MSNPAPAWFDEAYYAQQKAAQMNAIGWLDASGKVKTDWVAEDWPDALAHYNATHNTNFTSYDNFLACNGGEYLSGISMAAINVSANANFDVAIYTTNLANHYNKIGFAAAGYAQGRWTAEDALTYMLEVEHISAWEHFKAYGLEAQLNPSNKFDTAAYLRARAQAMGNDATLADAIAAIQREGLNPLEDYYAFGQAHHIAATMVANPVVTDFTDIWGKPVDVTPGNPSQNPSAPGIVVPPAGGSGSGGGTPQPSPPSASDQPGNPGEGDAPPTKPVTPSDVDVPPVEEDNKYDDPKEEIPVVPGETVTSPDNEDVNFEGTFGGNDSTLTPDTIIQGGAGANNSLTVGLGENWPGFNNPVTGVGSVALNNDSSSGANLTFNASNIVGLEQLELDNKDNGTISITDAPNTVKIINIKNISGDGVVPATTLGFANAPETLQIGLENVCFGDAGSAAPIKITGVAGIAFDSKGGGNAIDLGTSIGIEKIIVGGSADLSIAHINGDTTTAMDASGASGNVKFAVDGFQDGTEVKGGSGTDTLVLNDPATLQATKLTSVENIVFAAEGTFDASHSSGVQSIAQMGDQSVRVSHITAKNLNFYTDLPTGNNADTVLANSANPMVRAAGNGTLQASVKGEIGNVIYHACGMKEKPIDVDFVTDAVGNFTIQTEGGNALGVMSSFDLSKLTGKITIIDPTPTAAGSYTNDLNVIMDGIKLEARNAVALDISHEGSMRICGALDSVKDVKADLVNHGVGNEADLFKLSQLPSAGNVDINLGGMEAYFTALGTETSPNAMDLQIVNGQDVYIGGLFSSKSITAEINSDYTEIKQIETKGDLNLTVSGQNLVAQPDPNANPNDWTNVHDGFIGAAVNIDFSGIKGYVGDNGVYSYEMMIDVEARGGALTYTGAQGTDRLMIGALTGGTTSQVNTGGGNDLVYVQTYDYIAEGALAVLNIDLGEGNDILRVDNMDQTGNLIVNATSANLANLEIYTWCHDDDRITSVAQANAALKVVNAGFELDADTVIENGVFEYGGNAYWIASDISPNNQACVTLVVLEGGSTSQIQDDAVYWDTYL